MNPLLFIVFLFFIPSLFSNLKADVSETYKPDYLNIVSPCLKIDTMYASHIRAKRIEFSPSISLKIFSSSTKHIYGKVPGGEIIYHINTNYRSPYLAGSIYLRSIGIIFDYKYMNDVIYNVNPVTRLFGDSYSLLGGVNVDLFRMKGFSLMFMPALGLTYVGNTYFNDSRNELIGSHINFAVKGSLKLQKAVSYGTSVSAGIDIMHYSNSGIRLPNSGINFVSINLGILNNLKPAVKSVYTYRDYSDYKKHNFDMGINLGMKGLGRTKEYKIKTCLSAGYNYRMNRILGLAAVTDIILDNQLSDDGFAERLLVGLGFGPDIWIERFAVTVKAGYYVCSNNNFDHYRNLYWTCGLKYNIYDWLAVNAKSHINIGKADFFSAGFIFNL